MDSVDQAILDWLTPVDYAPQQSHFIGRRQEGTGQWLLNSNEFQEWLNNKNQTLFCPGMPGAGKTILTSIVIEHLCTEFQDDASIGIAYLYCNLREQDTQKPADLLLSLLKQLVQSSVPESIKSLYERHNRRQTRPSLEEISKALHSVITDHSRTFLIVDALDECQVSDRDIAKEFNEGTSLEIRASDEDVGRYIDGHISELPSFVQENPKLQEEIKAAIVKAVDGMFLLAQLHLHSLIGKRSPEAVRIALQQLPSGSKAYDHAYDEAMDRIKGQIADSQELAKRVLSWLTCAKRPLTTSELQHALAVEIGASELNEENLGKVEDMTSVCAGLVTVDRTSNIIRLVHYTTHEYFQRTWASWFPDAEKDIAKTCVTYLCFTAFETGLCSTDKEFEARLQLNPLYDYAARNWGHHARSAATEMEKLILGLLENEAKVSASSQVVIASGSYSGNSQRVPRQMTGAHLAAYFGLKGALMALLKNGHHLDCKDTYGRTPLSRAAENGHEAAAKLLLEKGAELESKDRYGQTPLSWAAGEGHEAVVKLLLLEKGAELESKDTRWGQTPLLWAAREGKGAVVKLLLEKGAELEFKDRYGQTPLSWAAEEGHEAVVKLLLEKGAKLETKDYGGQTPLSWAAEKGHETVVKLLIEKGAQLESKSNYSQTPLSWAAENGHEAIVKLLVEKGAELESKDYGGQTPLSWAAEEGHEAVAKVLQLRA